MLSISAYNALSARADALMQQMAQAAIAHHPVVSPIEELERWLSRRSQVLHLQLALLRDADAAEGAAIGAQQTQQTEQTEQTDRTEQAQQALTQRYLAELDALAATIAARYRETIEARMPDTKIARVVAEDGSGLVPLDAGELARRVARFGQRLDDEMAVHRRFAFGPPRRWAALRADLEHEWSALEAMLYELKEQLDALNLPTVEQQARIAQAVARLRGERHAGVVDAGLHQGWLQACREGRLDVVLAVVQTVPPGERLAFVDRPGLDGRTAFHLACEHHEFALAVSLLKLGADPHRRTEAGRLPMQLATHEDHGERTRTLLAWLKIQGADPLARDDNGRSALNEAAYHGNRAAIGWLLEQGASLAERDRQQRTPLHAAAAAGHAATVSLLLALGADPQARNGAGERPIFEACRAGRVEAMRAFLDAGLWLDADERRQLQQGGMVGETAVAQACGAPLRAALAQTVPAVDARVHAAVNAAAMGADGATAGEGMKGKAEQRAATAAAAADLTSKARPVPRLPPALRRLRQWF
ncbi:ankyrin repeat domain-containing protein [Cupriavidus gilardii]|uniref:ankyrin repeat domain-containing protein n=1 Tax=Cupriavidus gilardii TaxID=82541 RepID=UPI00158104EA|nr:ankyrin repeat domain-containing protein [Cupriavidus gilardii]MCT9073429.1 ankyrin repeat domain-containing protein [Cupriavidus gilardii]QKS64200.1 ankyrin repeat domain-containing protein [Cupriavidus gilardii]